jgi:hypothetical protein
MINLEAKLRVLHPEQQKIVDNLAKRTIIRAGRRGGKTTLAADIAVNHFLSGGRVLYAVPTQEQVEKFWFEVTRSLAGPIEAGVLYKNETRHVIEIPGTEQRIRAKTAWNADTLRGDYASLLILDEYQLMCEDAWELVGAPMLLDTDGDAIFIYTPLSLRVTARSKARDPRHAAKLFKQAKEDETGRWAAFHFTSHDNPHISKQALEDISGDMTAIGFRQEIMAEDIDDNPGALWRREWIEDNRLLQAPELARIAVAVDPSVSAAGDEWGIVGGGMAQPEGSDKPHLYVLEDASLQATPEEAAKAVVALYHRIGAARVVAEANQGGEMITTIIHQVDPDVPVNLVHASKGKQARAEPASVVYQQGRGHHVGSFPFLEDELCLWEPGSASPNRLDALVWLADELVLKQREVKISWF